MRWATFRIMDPEWWEPFQRLGVTGETIWATLPPRRQRNKTWNIFIIQTKTTSRIRTGTPNTLLARRAVPRGAHSSSDQIFFNTRGINLELFGRSIATSAGLLSMKSAKISQMGNHKHPTDGEIKRSGQATRRVANRLLLEFFDSNQPQAT